MVPSDSVEVRASILLPSSQTSTRLDAPLTRRWVSIVCHVPLVAVVVLVTVVDAWSFRRPTLPVLLINVVTISPAVPVLNLCR